MKSKTWLFIVVAALVAVLVWRYFKAGERRDACDALPETVGMRQQLERLAAGRDSVIELLRRREERYRAAVDSLTVVIDRLQAAQTQNRKQYENDRSNIMAMPGDGHYRFVSDYIARYADSLQR